RRARGPEYSEEVSDVDPTLSSTSPSSSTSTDVNRPAGAVSLGPLAPAPLTPEEEVLVSVLIKRGLVTAAQIRAAQQYGHEHQRDLRQSILELSLISPELLNQLAFERL